MSRDERRLDEIGERAILSEFFESRYVDVQHFGSDSAASSIGPGCEYLVASTDPCPPPMAAVLGYDRPFYAGWLLATINFSDIAASGAAPCGLLTSLILPGDFRVWQLTDLLDGIDASANAIGSSVLGGNIKDGPQLALTATAFGFSNTVPNGRGGGADGDLIAVVGDIGMFWAGVFSHRRGLIDGNPEDHILMKNVLRPTAQVWPMQRLTEKGLIRGAMDNSDGLAPTLREMSRASDLGVKIDVDRIEWPTELQSAAGKIGIEPLRLAFGWGDWNVLVAIRREDVDAARTTCQECGSGFLVIGELTSDDPLVTIRYEGRDGEIGRFESERFAADSWMRDGIDGYIKTLEFGDLFSRAK